MNLNAVPCHRSDSSKTELNPYCHVCLEIFLKLLLLSISLNSLLKYSSVVVAGCWMHYPGKKHAMMLGRELELSLELKSEAKVD